MTCIGNQQKLLPITSEDTDEELYESSYIWTGDSDMKIWLTMTVIHTTFLKLKPENNSGLNGIQAHDLCHTGAVFYHLSYQAN